MVPRAPPPPVQNGKHVVLYNSYCLIKISTRLPGETNISLTLNHGQNVKLIT